MKKKIVPMLLVLCAAPFLMGSGCMSNSETKDRDAVSKQQEIYQKVQPVHIYDYSIPRDIYQQIYDVTTTKTVATYTIIESVTGVTRYHCPSIGYALPADIQLTNPLQAMTEFTNDPVVEQAEPNGLFSSKNTDGTWVLCVELRNGEVYPVYTEHKVSTFPFIVEKDKDGEWVRADNKPIGFKVEIRKSSGPPQVPPPVKK